MQKPVYCFIDDSPFEIKLFRDVFEPLTPAIQFICAHTFGDCQKQLDQQNLYPSLFILDLYGREGKSADVTIPARDTLATQVDRIPDISSIFSDLESFSGDKDLQVNEFLKRLFAIVNIWRNIFSAHCTDLDQGRSYGLNNLKQVRDKYPFAAAVIYTRKGLFSDAVEIFHYECDGIFSKPMGSSDEEIYTETRSLAHNLMDTWHESVKRRLARVLEKSAMTDSGIHELAEFFSVGHGEKPDNHGEEKAERIGQVIDSPESIVERISNMSTLAANALTLWTRFYLGWLKK